MNNNKNDMFKKREVRTEFKDNRERFRLYNSMKKMPHRLMFHALSFVSIILSIVSLVYPGAYYSTIGWVLWVLGLVTSIGFEEAANIHYMQYSKIANDKRIDSIKFNIRINKVLRSLSMLSWFISGMALALMVVSKSSSLASIW